MSHISKRDLDRFRREFNKLRRKSDRLDDASVRKILSILREARERIASRVASGFELAFLRELETAINEIFEEFNRRSIDVLSSDTVEAFDLGVDMVDLPIRRAGGQQRLSVLPDVSIEVLERQLERGVRFITNLSAETANRVNGQIILGLTGERTPVEIMRGIGVNINKGVFKTARDRAEAIVRTEINSALNTATNERIRQLSQEIAGVKKYWLHPGDTGNPHARGEHIALWRATDPSQGGVPIPSNRDFNLGGFRAAGPHDPRLPARHVIQCRCRAVTWIAESDLTEERRLRAFG